jgi:hypothetical protein
MEPYKFYGFSMGLALEQFNFKCEFRVRISNMSCNVLIQKIHRKVLTRNP